MTVSVTLRSSQSNPLSWIQIDGNWTALAAAVNANAAAIAAIRSASAGPTVNRPIPTLLGQIYFDTTLGQPVWCSIISPATWVNSAGVSV